MFQPVLWRQGMLLKPQHFQHAEQVLQSSQWKIWQRTSIYPWGFIEHRIDETLLSAGMVTVEALEVVFPDGTWAKKDVNAVVVATPFNKENLFAKSNYMIYAGIRKMMPDQVNVTMKEDVSSGDVRTRFHASPQGHEVNNLYEEDVSANIQTMAYIVQLFTSENVAEMSDCVVIPLASLYRSEKDEVKTNPAYIPPLIRIESSPALLEALSGVYNDIKRSINQLESYKIHDNVETSKDSLTYLAPILVKYRLALQVLSRYLMDVRHVLREPIIHPRDAFLMLQNLIAELTPFTPKVSLLSVDVEDHSLCMNYDHFDIAPLFSQSVRLIKTLLDEIVVSEDLNISTTREGEDIFAVVIPESFFRLNNRFYLVIITPEEPKNWLEDFTSFARVASGTRLKELIRRSLPGLRFEQVHDTPAGLPARQNAYYFQLEQNGSIWEDIYSSRSIAVGWDGAPEHVKLDISVIEG